MSNSKQKYAYTIVACGIIILGLVLIVLSGFSTNSLIVSSMQNTASALIIAGIFSLVNEYFLKDKLVELILEKLHLKESINKTGIEALFYNISEIQYKDYIRKTNKHIDIIHVYGRTWTNTNLDDLTDKFLNSNCNIRVILTSPDSVFIEGLAKSYGITADDLRKTIWEMVGIWKGIAQKKTGRSRKKSSTLKVYFHKGFPSHALYRFDNQIVFVQSRLSNEKTKRLASMVTKKTSKEDSLFNTFLADINQLILQSEEVQLTNAEGGGK
jgi:hypothetical protein